MATAVSSATQIVRDNKTTRTNDINNLSPNDFLKLLLVQLQQQDPLAPTDTNAMIQQVNTIREIAASTQLTSTLGSVQMGSNLATASGLIGKKVTAMGDDGKDVTGTVTKVTVTTDSKDDSKRSLRVRVGDTDVKLENIREVVP